MIQVNQSKIEKFLELNFHWKKIKCLLKQKNFNQKGI